MNFRWQYSARGSVWYAAWRWLAGCHDPRWQHVAPWCEALALSLSKGPFGPGNSLRSLFDHLLAAVADEPQDDTNFVRATVERFFHDAPNLQTPNRQETGTIVASLVVDMTDRLATVHLETELLLRVGPLREQWEARGPGMLHFLRKTLWPEISAEPYTVLCVDPVGGQGGGAAFTEYPLVVCEALLTNVTPNLPEVARLAWLAAHRPARRASERPALGDASPASDKDSPPTAIVPPLRMLIPAVLQAAEYVELAAYDLPTLRLALRLWSDLPTADAASDDLLAERLWSWWNDERARSAGWRDALNRYNQMQ